mgnify:CR=1 FL=1
MLYEATNIENTLHLLEFDQNESGKIRLNNNGRCIGVLYFEPNNRAGLAEIHYLKVNREYRRRGIGSQLIGQLKELCQSQYNSTDIEVYITPVDDVHHDILKEFYESNGFVVTEHEEEPESYNGMFAFNVQEK